MAPPIGIELFSGCGGLSTGFLDAGLRVSGGFDIDRRSIEAYNYNHLHRGSRGFVADLSQTSGAQLLAMAGLAKVDFILGGPPCQPFSIAGKRGGGNDKRSELIGEYLRLTDELRPRFILFENVPNLAVVDEGQLLLRFARGLNRLGYTVNYEVMAAADYGVPQIRRRLFLVGGLGSAIELPEGTHGIYRKPYVTTQQAIGDLPPAGDYGEIGIYNHEPTEHSLDMLERFASLPPGKREPRSFHDRLHPERPSYTLRAGTGNFSPLRPIHYHYDRVVTVRESARLQSFDDTFIWPDWIPRLQQYRQVGNAVPPKIAKTVAECVARQLGWRLTPATLKGDYKTRPEAITLTDEERKAQRRKRTRGASLGFRPEQDG